MLRHEALQLLLSGVPADVWDRHWPATHTRMLRQACKALRQLVDGLLLPKAMRLPTAVRVSKRWWLSYSAVHGPAKWLFLMQQLAPIAASANITVLDLRCGSKLDGLHPVLQVCPHLHSFSLQSNGNLGPAGTALLAQALQPCTGVTHLRLRRNDMGLTGLHALAPTLASLLQLRLLDVGSNALGNRGVEALAGLFDFLTGLATLNLSGNAMQPDGATTLALSVSRLSRLTHLDIASNEIMNAGCTALAYALAHCSHLRCLDLQNNR